MLGAIGADARVHKEIAKRTGLSATTLGRAFEILDAKGMTDRVTPYSAKAAPKNRRYRVADPYMRLWLRFVGPYIDEIERSRGAVEVDLVGGDTRPVADHVAFLGSIKWRERAPFTAADTATLAAQRDAVPGADHRTALIGVSRSGFDADTGLDLRLGPDDLL